MSSFPPVNGADESAQAVRCHFIIGHPNKPKFMIVQHGTGWEPPTLNLPAQRMEDLRPSLITREVLQKYGLRATVLRIWLTTPTYACIELEVHKTRAFGIQAVWVDLDTYTQRFEPTEHDPFVAWLREKASGSTPGQRSPWQRQGWLSEAGSWIHSQMKGLGMEPPVGIAQFKAGLERSCVLQVRSNDGDMWFKAAYQRPPGEARLTSALCKKWPEIVTTPFVVDAERNWLFMPDFRQEGGERPEPDTYPEFAAALGRLQFESLSFLDEWRELDCPDFSVNALQERRGISEELYQRVESRLGEGVNPLDEAQRAELHEAIDLLRNGCGRLAEFGIPDTLTHLDFRADNFYVYAGHCRIFDWGDVAITHPFFALAYALHLYRTADAPDLGFRHAAVIDDRLVHGMRDRYISQFSALAPPERLEEALDLACAVFPLFDFLNGASELQYFEPGGQQQLNLLHSLRQRARTLLIAARVYQSACD